MRAFLFLVLVVSFAAQAKDNCGKGNVSGTPYTWCITKGESNEILYFMHGGGGSEKSWDSHGYAGFLNDRWEKIGFKKPHVITVSFGTNWLLTDMKTKEHPALLNAFVEKIMPKLEKKIPGKHGRRMLMGGSMGGYNGSELALRYPQLWDRAAILCFGVYTTDPFDSDENIEKYIAAIPAGAKPGYIRGIVGWVRREFQTKENWERHNPLALAGKIKSLKPTYHMSCTKDDQYGFYEGARKMAEVIATNTAISFNSMEKGGHCYLDTAAEEALGDFLAGK